MFHIRALVVFLVLAGVSLVQAAPLPSFMRDGNSRFLARSLGSACYTMDSVQRTLPCNPAAIAKERAPRFDADLFMVSNIDYLQDAENILDGTSS